MPINILRTVRNVSRRAEKARAVLKGGTGMCTTISYIASLWPSFLEMGTLKFQNGCARITCRREQRATGTCQLLQKACEGILGM